MQRKLSLHYKTQVLMANSDFWWHAYAFFLKWHVSALTVYEIYKYVKQLKVDIMSKKGCDVSYSMTFNCCITATFFGMDVVHLTSSHLPPLRIQWCMTRIERWNFWSVRLVANTRFRFISGLFSHMNKAWMKQIGKYWNPCVFFCACGRGSYPICATVEETIGIGSLCSVNSPLFIHKAN